MPIQNRIKSLRRVRAGDLVPNPRNWRTHPTEQRQALRGMLKEVGIVDAVLARELEDGRLMIVDGHLRASLDPNDKVPVLVLDITEQETDLVLATYDPVSSLAGADQGKLEALVNSLDVKNEHVAALLEDIAAPSIALELDDTPPGEDAPADESGESEDEKAEGDDGEPDEDDDAPRGKELMNNTDFLVVRRFEIPMDGSVADQFEAAINAWTERTGTSYGLMRHIAEHLKVEDDTDG